MKNNFIAATLLTGLLLGVHAPNASAIVVASGPVTVEELAAPSPSRYDNVYRITNNSQSTIAFFAATNRRGWGTGTTQPGWQTEISAIRWYGQFANQSYVSRFGSYETLFGPLQNGETYVNFYWTTDADTYGIKPGETFDKFFFNAPWASQAVTWDENKQVISQSYRAPGAPTAVPEPGVLSLFGLAIAGLLVARYRKQV